jgi:hypothetical protein
VSVAAIAAVFFSSQTRRGLIGPQVLELRLAQEPLKQHAADPLTGIHVVRPDWGDCVGGAMVYDEFGLATNMHPWTPPSFVWSITRDHDAPYLRPVGDLPVTSSRVPLTDPRPGLLQIDLRQLKSWSEALDWFAPP